MTESATESYCPPARSWPQKFRDAGRGLLVAWRGQSSFAVHFVMALAVIAVAGWCRVSQVEWCLLILCIATVVGAELVNTALEKLAKSVTTRWDPNVRDALDIGSGVVLAVSLAAAVVGCIILLPYLVALW